MKRDMDLIRAILMAVESNDSGFAPKLEIPGYTQEQVGYHVILLGEAGLAKVADMTHHDSKSPEGIITRLTWAGYEFLDSSRNDTIWNQAKATMMNTIGAISFQMLTTILFDLMKKKVGL